MKTFFITFLLTIFFTEIYFIIKILEYSYCIYFKHQIPFVASNKQSRKIIAHTINTIYPNKQTVIEFGSGYGGMARYIARSCNVQVLALENMPFCAMISKIIDTVSWQKKSKTIFCDAFKYCENKHFDICIIYMGPGANTKIQKLFKNFDVMLSLDIPLPDLPPIKIIDIGPGYTRFKTGKGSEKYPHKLFVYEK